MVVFLWVLTCAFAQGAMIFGSLHRVGSIPVLSSLSSSESLLQRRNLTTVTTNTPYDYRGTGQNASLLYVDWFPGLDDRTLTALWAAFSFTDNLLLARASDSYWEIDPHHLNRRLYNLEPSSSEVCDAFYVCAIQNFQTLGPYLSPLYQDHIVNPGDILMCLKDSSAHALGERCPLV